MYKRDCEAKQDEVDQVKKPVTHRAKWAQEERREENVYKPETGDRI